MGLFYKQSSVKQSTSVTESWPTCESQSNQQTISGKFHETQNNGRTVTKQYVLNGECIYFIKNKQRKGIQLYLLVVQQHLCLDHKKRVYQLKLYKNQQVYKLYTYDLTVFTKFYVHLAKFCIMTSFQRHYLKKQLLGEGAFSKVYNGQNILSREEVALKVFEKSFLSSLQDGKVIISNEIATLQKLRRYNLSPLISIYQTSDCIILVMQKAEAGNMLDYLKGHAEDYGEELIKNMIFKVLQSLRQLHMAGFIHRDIKPQNILFRSFSLKSSLFLGDFGLTVQKKECNCTKIGKICSGTMGFVAPQILYDNRYDEKCDIFSLGCLFYYLHKGKSLFCGKNVNQICITQDQHVIQRKISQLKNLNAKGKKLLQSLLMVNPQDRISAEEAINDSYFKQMQRHQPSTGEQDRTLEQYVLTRVNKFFQ